MFDIQGILVSLDVVERMFCCDLGSCKGECCIEGDAGAPLTDSEALELREILPMIWNDLLPGAKREIEMSDVACRDDEGDLVTSTIGGGNCVFTCYDETGTCMCAIEKAWREGRIKTQKPISCALYPLRIKEYPKVTVVNYHDWKICKCAKKIGLKKGIRLYQFLEQPLIRRFGKEWYEELKAACELYLKTYPNGIDQGSVEPGEE